jgi:hypothetical protein
MTERAGPSVSPNLDTKSHGKRHQLQSSQFRGTFPVAERQRHASTPWMGTRPMLSADARPPGDRNDYFRMVNVNRCGPAI